LTGCLETKYVVTNKILNSTLPFRAFGLYTHDAFKSIQVKLQQLKVLNILPSDDDKQNHLMLFLKHEKNIIDQNKGIHTFQELFKAFEISELSCSMLYTYTPYTFYS